MEKTCLHRMEECPVPGILKNQKGTTRYLSLVFLAIMLFGSLRQVQATQVSGSLTVDPGGTPSATVFKDLRSVITYLTSASVRTDAGPANAAPFGVSGALTINIAAGTYIEQVDIPAITGASSTNTITLQGAGKANTIVNCTTATTALRYTIRLNSTSWVIVRDMTIRAGTASVGWPVHIFGSTNNCRVVNCAIDFGTTPLSSQTSDSYAGLVMNSNATSLGTAGMFANIDIDTNFIYGGHYSIYAAGTSASSVMIRIRTNNCDSANRYGLYFSGIGELKCNGNTVENRYNSLSVTDGAGIYLNSCSPPAASGRYHEINNNKIMNAESYGMFFNSNVTLASPARCQIINNVVAGGFRGSNPSGIYMSYSGNANSWNVYHNSVVLDNLASGSSSGAFFGSLCCVVADQMDVRNNHFVVLNPASSSLPVYIQNWAFGSWATQFNYNNFYKKGQTSATPLIYITGTTYTSSTLTTAGGAPYNLNSVSKDPMFVSNYNLTPLTSCADGTNIAAVTTDINNTTRAATPDIGAYEYATAANDVALAALLGPAIPFNAGTQNVVVTLHNAGSTTLTAATVGYQVNGGAPVTQAWTGSLASCASTTVTFSGAQAISISTGTSYTIKAFTNAPNGSADGNPANDSVMLSGVTTSLSGSYTIDPAGSGATNFTTFTDAASALASGGVSGPVTFTVAAGTYTEQVSISAVAGASATNTITFNGGTGNAATRIVTFAATNSAAPHTFRLDNASYVTLNNLTIRATGTSNGWPVHLINGSYLSVRNCVITFTGTGLTSSSTNFIPFVANGSGFSATVFGTPSNLLIENNTISGGYAGIYIYGNSLPATNTHAILNNNISNCGSYGISEYYVYNDLDIRNNIIAMRTPNAGGVGINASAIQSLTSPADITGNTIKDAGQYGIQLFNVNGSATYPVNIANNMIGGGFTSASANGIYMSSGNYVNLYFNSINLDMANQTASYGAVNVGNISNMDIRNNNFAVTGANSVAFPLLTTSCTFTGLDYNNYYRTTNAVQLISLNGAFYSQSGMIGAGGYNTNSRSTDPEFTGTKDLHTTLKCMTGTAISGYATDIDGSTRSNPPYIGADENTVAGLSTDLTVQSIAAPTIPFANGSQDISALIRNNGTSTITSATIYYRVNGGTPVSQAWSGSLAPCATATVTFTGASQYTFAGGTAYTIEAFSDQPNGSADNNKNNDTAKVSVLSTGLSGNYTINASGSGATNYVSFTTAIAALTTNGVAGPVVFTVAPNTYTAQNAITAIPGASATNTITFDGGNGNAASVIMTFASTNSSAKHTLRFDNAQWIRLRNMSIIASGTQAWPLFFYNNASNIQVRNCIISCTQTMSSQTSVSYIPVVFSNSTSSNTTSMGSFNVDIDSNTIQGGWYGISVYSNTAAGACPNINIRNNRIDSAGLYAVYLYYPTASKVNDNTINMRVSNGASLTSNAIFMQTCLSSVSDNIQINRNKIINSTQYGIYLASSGGSATTMRAQIINNSIGGGFTNASASGIYLSSSTYWDILFNSVNIDNAATGTAQCIYLSTASPTFCDIRNNNFAVTHTGASGAVAYRSVNGATVNALNYNNYYKAGAIASTNIINVGGTNYTPATYNTAAAGGANSISQNAAFTTSTNLLPTVNTNKGISLINVPTDIAGTYRNIPPDLGAYELPSLSATDLAIISLNSPDTTLPIGSYNVAVTVRNFGSAPITSFNLRQTVNGLNLQDTAITGINLAQNSAMTVNMGSDKQASFAISPNTLKVYLHQPNGSNDGNQANDSFIVGPRYPAMSGVFTINPAGSGSTNFTTFNAAITALNSGGVSGPVTFNVAAATFNEQITINALSGSSAANTVKFVGSGIATTILNFAGAAAPNHHTVRLNGSNWISFENMTLSGGGTTSNWVLHFMNATNCTVKKCKITLSGLATTSTNASFLAIVGSNSSALNGETSLSATLNNIVIDSNVIEYGYYGVILSCNNSTAVNYLRGNTITNAYNTGAYLYYTQAWKAFGNTITMRSGNAGSMGINVYAANATSPMYSEIKNNIITNAGQYGIYMSSASGSSSPATAGEIVNNISGSGFTSTNGVALYMNSCSNWRVWHNTFSYDGAGTSLALNVLNGSGNDIRNNIFAIRNATATLAYPVSINPATAVSVFNYNNLYNAASTNLLNVAGNMYITTNYSNTYPLGAGINARNFNPNFSSATNLHINEACMNGDNLGVTTDIDGNARGTTPDMGADELITIPALDASVAKINAPGFPFAAGSQPVNITIQNNGTTTLNTLTLSYTVNGSAPVTQTWTGTLASCDTLNFTFSSNFTFGAGPNVLKVYAAAPNSLTDANNVNDTVSTSPFCVGLNGTYTINPAGSGPLNFTSFNAAIAALNCSGLTGPVVLNVANGTYNEQVSLTSYQGLSATNTLTIQSASGNAANVTLGYAPGAENYTLFLNSADYITLRNITLANTGNTSGYYNVVQIANGANNNTFRGCTFTNATPTSGYLVYSSNTTDNNNTFTGNTFTGGSAGIFWQSNSSALTSYAQNLVVDSNTFLNQNNYALYLFYMTGVKIRNNQFTSSPTTTYYGIYGQGFYQNSVVLNNSVFVNNTTSTAYGIALYAFNQGSSSARALVANNMIRLGTAGGTGSCYGLYLDQYCYYTDVLHNTVNIAATTGPSYAMSISQGFAGYTVDNCTFANNIFQSLSTNASSAAFYHNQSGAPLNQIINYNLYYAAAGSVARFQNSNRVTLTDWKTANPTYNVNSISRRIEFAGANDLHNNTPCTDNLGSNAYVAIVPTDADGQNRNASTPDIGADEYTALPYDVKVSRISAPLAYSASLQTVKAWIVNNGSITATSVDMGYAANGNTPVTQVITGLSLAPCDSVEVTFATQISTPTGYSVLKAFVNGTVNGNADPVRTNDSALVSFCTSLGGSFTINAGISQSATNFQSFTSAISAMKSCGLSGPAYFTVAPGTYTEQITIANIPGVSATNTITFDGVDTSNRIIQYNLAGNTNRHVILIDSCRYVTIKNLKIVNNSVSYGWGVHIRGVSAAYTSDFARVKGCAFVLPVTTSSNFTGVVASSSTSSSTTANNFAQNLSIDSNGFTGGYAAVQLNGPSTTIRSVGNSVTGNNIQNPYNYGVYAQNQADITVNRNYINNVGRSTSQNTYSYGIYLNYADSFELSKNRVYGSPGGVGMQVQNATGTSVSPNLISNNMVQIGEALNNGQGIYISSAPFTKICYNSVYATSATNSTSNCALYATSSASITVLNNNLATQYNNLNYIMIYSGSTFVACDNNNYYGGTYYNGNPTFNTYKGSLYLNSDQNSKSVSPGFLSINDLHTPTNSALDSAGIVVAGVTDDIDGQLRSSIKPDIGADEFAAPTENSGVIAITNPSNPITAGLNEVFVVIRNFGASVLTTDSVFYQVGATLQARLWTGSLATNATDTVKFTLTSGPGSTDQRYNFPSGSSLIKAWTSYPNGIADVSTADDTTTLNVCTGYGGTYTINPAGSGPLNFTSFTAAANALQCGITAPVTFNVAPGTYTEQFAINPIPNSSAVNKVVFQPANGQASGVVIQFNAASAVNNYVARLAGAHYVTFDKLTFTAQNATNGIVIDIANYNAIVKPGDLTISNCVINGSVQNTTTAVALISCLVETPNLVISGNTFTRGSYALNYTGSSSYPHTSGLVVSNNIIGTTNTDAPYYYGLSITYARQPQITGNQFFSSSYTNYYGISLQVCSGKTRINNNKMYITNGGYGISLSSVNYNNEPDTAEIIQNAISVGGTSTAYGILFQSCGNFNIYYNSIYNYSTSANTYAFRTYASGTNHRKNRMQNNLLISTTGYAIYLDGNTTANAAACLQVSDYNNLYSGGANLGFITTTGNLAGLGAFRSIAYPGSDTNSVSGNPAFTGTNNLVPTSCMPNAKGTPLPGLLTDLNGTLRKAVSPDMGAYEFTPAIVAPAATSPVNLCYGSAATALTASGTNTLLWFTAASGGTGSAAAIVPNTGTRATQLYYVADSSATSGCISNRTAITVNIDTAVANNTISSAQSICQGSTPAALTGSTPTGGNGTFAYTWISSTTGAAAGFAAATGTNNTPGYAPSSLNANTWYKRVITSGACGRDTSAVVMIAVDSAIGNNTASGAQTICSGATPTALTGSTPTGGNNTFAYVWLSSTTSATTGFANASGTNNTPGYSPSALTATTWFKRIVTSGTCGADTSAAVAVTVNQPVANNTAGGAQNLCSGSTPTAFTGSTPTGGSGIFTYAWLSSTTSATSGFGAAAGTNNTQGYAPAALSVTTWFKRVVTSGACSSDTSAAVQVTVNASGTWTGAVSTAWSNTANWSCPQLPASSTNVIIPAGMPNMPVISDVQQANNITIQTGASLTMSGPGAMLSIYGNVTNNGTFNTSAGKLHFAGTAPQVLNGGTYSKLEVNNSNGVSLGGAVTLTDSLQLTNGILSLGNNNLTIGTVAVMAAGSSSSYLRTNGTGNVRVQNIGTSGKTGNVLIPVGNSTYNPVVLSNSGTADEYAFLVIDSVTATYSANTPTGTKLTSNAVNRTWIINENTAGGSNASVTLQWNTADELGGFTRATSYVSHYNGTSWMGNTASAASGSNPYTQTRIGITSFSPFGVGSNGALPVEMLGFTGTLKQRDVVLNWSTASERNNKGFDVQRSADGRTWTTIAAVKGAGNSARVNTYSAIDADAFRAGMPVLYYRLKQTDLNGAATYTHTVIVNGTVRTASLSASVMPNPFAGSLQVNITTPATETAVITITDMAGKTVFLQQQQCSEGENTIMLNSFDAWSAGMYFVSIRMNNDVITHKVVKQ